MTDKIVHLSEGDWKRSPGNKGQSKYSHLWDGKARELDMRDYGHIKLENFRVTLNAAARHNGYWSRTMTVDEFHLIFQVTGKR